MEARAYVVKDVHTFAGRANGLFVANVITLVVIWAAVMLRLYVRAGLLKTMGIDDYLMVACLLCFTWMSLAMIMLVYFGFGQHLFSVPVPELMKAFQAYLLGQLGYVATVLFFKLSVSWFYLRITNLKWQRATIYTLVVINVLYTIGYFILIIFQCTPVSHLWTQFQGSKGKCISESVVINTSYTHNAISIASDWILALLPVFLIKDAKLNMRTKVIVVLLLGLGFFASVASLVRITKLGDLSSSLDYTYTVVPIIMWSAVEAAVGILAANLATYRPLFQSLVETVVSNSGSRSRGNSTGGSRGPRGVVMPWSRRARHGRKSGDGYILSDVGNDMPSLQPSTTHKSVEDAGGELHKASLGSDGKYVGSTSDELSDEEMGITRHTELEVTESWDPR